MQFVMKYRNMEFQNLGWEEKVLGMPKIPRGSNGESEALKEILRALQKGDSLKKHFQVEGSTSTATLERLAVALRPTGLIKKVEGNWEISDVAKVWLESNDDTYIIIFFCSRIAFMGELLFALQEPKNISEIMRIAQEDYDLSWRTTSEINNRLKWFRDLAIVEYIEYKGQYVLTDKGRTLITEIDIVKPEDFHKDCRDNTINETHIDLSDWAYKLCCEKENDYGNRKSSIGYIVGGKYEMQRTIVGYLHFIGGRKSMEEIREYSKKLYAVRDSSINAFMTMMNNVGLIERISRNEYALTDLGFNCLHNGNDIDLIACLHCAFLFVFEILNELKNKTLSNKELAALAKSAYGFNRESVDEMNSRIIILQSADLIREVSFHKFGLTHRGELLLEKVPVQKRVKTEIPLKDFGKTQKANNPYDDIITELRLAAKDSSNPERLEHVVKDVFEMLGFDAKWIGHAGNTDVLLTANGPANSIYKVAIDAKSTSGGEVTDGLVDFDTLKEHKQKHGANYNIIVGGKFSQNRLAKRAEEHGVALIDVDALEIIIKKHFDTPLTMGAFRALFMQRGIVDISVLDKEIDSLNRVGIIINLVMKCLLNESADEVTKGILSVREIYRTVRDSDEISESLLLGEIEKVLEFLSSPIINGVGKSKDGYCANSSLEEIGQKFTYYSKYCKNR